MMSGKIMEEEKIIVLGYFSDKEDDGEPLYTNVKIFKSYKDFENYMYCNHNMKSNEVAEFFKAEEPVDDMVVWEQPFDK